jgi:hypothetical protein
MLKRSVTYTNYDNEEVTEELCFHLSKAELIQMEVEIPEGIEAHLKKVAESSDGKLIIATMKDLILRSYGIRDGNRFRKNAAIREEFEASEAFSELFMELATKADVAAEFVVGIMPANLDADIAKITQTEETPTMPRSMSRVEAESLSHEELVRRLQLGFIVTD